MVVRFVPDVAWVSVGPCRGRPLTNAVRAERTIEHKPQKPEDEDDAGLDTAPAPAVGMICPSRYPRRLSGLLPVCESQSAARTGGRWPSQVESTAR